MTTNPISSLLLSPHAGAGWGDSRENGMNLHFHKGLARYWKCKIGWPNCAKATHAPEFLPALSSAHSRPHSSRNYSVLHWHLEYVQEKQRHFICQESLIADLLIGICIHKSTMIWCKLNYLALTTQIRDSMWLAGTEELSTFLSW